MISREESTGLKKLVAYVIPCDGQSMKPEGLREYLKKELPDYMVPAHVVTLNAFPTTPNNKIDRKALPPPEKTQRTPRADYDPPATPIEKALAAVWAEALGLEEIDRSANFFDLGGDSLTASIIMSSIRRTCRIDLPLLMIFLAPTVAALGEKLEQGVSAAGGDGGSQAEKQRRGA